MKNLLLLSVIPFSLIGQWTHYDFDEGMHFGTPYAFDGDMSFDPADMKKISDATMKDGDYDGIEFYNFCKNLYEKNNPTVAHVYEEVRIPKIIHQIWVGSELPLKFKPLIDTWKSIHAQHGWVYKLWTDADVVLFGMYNKQYYDALGTHYAMKADLLRLEILYRHGGVYIDTDFECLQSFDSFHHMYDFYVGLQPLVCGYSQLGSGIIGAKPQHPIIKDAIYSIAKNWHKRLVVSKTGPLAFSKSFLEYADKEDNIDIALPSIYLHPVSPYKKEGDYDMLVDQGSIAIHHWAATWVFSSENPRLIEYKKELS